MSPTAFFHQCLSVQGVSEPSLLQEVSHTTGLNLHWETVIVHVSNAPEDTALADDPCLFSPFQVQDEDFDMLILDVEPPMEHPSFVMADEHADPKEVLQLNTNDKLGHVLDVFCGAREIFDGGQTFLAWFRLNVYASLHQQNLYYPFASLSDWEIANFLLTSRLSMRAIDKFLSLCLMNSLPLSFSTAKELRSHDEMLPSGPCWNAQVVPTTHPMKKWMSSDGAWDLQLKFPEGNKTHITNMCSGKVAHPLLISLANIHMDIRNKGSSHAFLLLALMPIPAFTHPATRICSVLEFLTPEALHYWHCQFWDHDMQWCKHALGAGELDFWFSVLPPITSFRCCNQVIAVQALMEFRYLAQAPAITSQMHDRISAALKTFHDHKHAIIDAGLCCGQTTGAALDHWEIPKLEFMQSVAPSIHQAGTVIQWSADTTEHAHIEVVKDPVTTMNNQNYDSQICCTLDRNEKCCLFNTAVSLSEQTDTHDGLAGDDSETDALDHSDPNMADSTGDNAIGNILQDLWSSDCSPICFFDSAEKLSNAPLGSMPRPLCTLAIGRTAL
ncbi:hypothetical protein BKA83DRAFT_4119872 [Pisolithus microcarpus]|nr:hypothetical protein BKA83DRAFT_4119872 [Pisolithus microcarpus]